MGHNSSVHLTANRNTVMNPTVGRLRLEAAALRNPSTNLSRSVWWNRISLYTGRTTSKKNRFHSALVRRASARSDSTSGGVRDVYSGWHFFHSLNHLLPDVIFVWCPLTRCSRAILTASSTNCALWRRQYTWHCCRAETSSAIHCKSSHIYILVGRETGLARCLQPGGDLLIINRRLWSPSLKLHHSSTDVVADTLSDCVVIDRIAACTKSQACLSTNHLGHCLHHKAWVVWQRISSISVAATLRGGCIRCVVSPWRGTCR